MRTQLTRSIILFDDHGSILTSMAPALLARPDSLAEKTSERAFNTLLLGLSIIYLGTIFNPLLQHLY